MNNVTKIKNKEKQPVTDYVDQMNDVSDYIKQVRNQDVTRTLYAVLGTAVFWMFVGAIFTRMIVGKI